MPIGALVVGPTGEVVGTGLNRVVEDCDPTAHAEIDVLRRVGRALGQLSRREDCILYTSLEPCLMCTGAIIMAGLRNVVWAADDPTNGAARKLHASPLPLPGFDKITWYGAPYPDLAERSTQLLTQWQVLHKSNQ